MTVRTALSSETDDRRTALDAFARALRRESHVLREWPELTWQQLHNRLQWAEPPLADRLSAERERRSLPGARPWIHRYSQLQESEALARTLTGHTEPVNGLILAGVRDSWMRTSSRSHGSATPARQADRRP